MITTRTLLTPALCAALLAVPPLCSAQSSASPAPKIGDENVVRLSPFEVVSDTTGYDASHTMSGTRLKSKIEDLSASITVETQQQMSDFALLDLNDIFNDDTEDQRLPGRIGERVPNRGPAAIYSDRAIRFGGREGGGEAAGRSHGFRFLAAGLNLWAVFQVL